MNIKAQIIGNKQKIFYREKGNSWTTVASEGQSGFQQAKSTHWFENFVLKGLDQGEHLSCRIHVKTHGFMIFIASRAY